jgi:hypothetical protein
VNGTSRWLGRGSSKQAVRERLPVGQDSGLALSMAVASRQDRSTSVERQFLQLNELHNATLFVQRGGSFAYAPDERPHTKARGERVHVLHAIIVRSLTAGARSATAESKE